MARRLTVFLLALAALFGSLLGPALPTARADSEAAQPRGCCGEACRCAQTCPCAERDDRSVPAGELPPATAPSRDQRAFLLHLPALASSLLSEQPLDERLPPLQPQAPRCAPTGREILARVSRWTT